MSYNIMRTGKIKDRAAITSAAAHNFRIRQQGNIDATRSALNQVLWNPMAVNLKHADALQKAITGRYEQLGVKERKNSVLAQEFVVSASPEFFEGLPPESVEQWAKHQLKFMQNEFGDNLQIAVLHLDEKTPHLHFLLSCEEKSVKRYKNQKGEFFKEGYSLNAKRWGPDFLKDLHTRHAKHNEILGLKRGKPSSDAVHKPVKEYYAELTKKEQELTQGLEEHNARRELVERAKAYMVMAKAKMDQQYAEIMELLQVVMGKKLSPEEAEIVDGIAIRHIQEQKKANQDKEAKKQKPVGGNPPHPQKRI